VTPDERRKGYLMLTACHRSLSPAERVELVALLTLATPEPTTTKEGDRG
jgi:hypothetical protein